MTVEVTRCENGHEWDQLLERSADSRVFHRSEFLASLERHSSGRLHRLVGYQGQEPVGVFPIFALSKGGVAATFSPPPRMGVLFQGPVVFETELMKQRKFEQRNDRFVSRCLDWIDETVGPRYERYCSPPGYTDVRPFSWAKYSVIPRYTYTVNLSREPNAIKRSFSRTPRRNLEKGDSIEIDADAGIDGIRFVHEQVTERYDAQGKTYSVPLEFLTDLYERTADGTVRSYVARLEGEPMAGLVTFWTDDRVYFSEGGAKPDTSVPFNDHLHWRVMCDAVDGGLMEYDLQGANTPRICRYKSKFNPTLRPYFEIEAGTPLTSLASKVYRTLR